MIGHRRRCQAAVTGLCPEDDDGRWRSRSRVCRGSPAPGGPPRLKQRLDTADDKGVRGDGIGLSVTGRPARLLVAAVVLLAGVLLATALPAALPTGAYFASTASSAGSTFATPAMFSRPRFIEAHDLRDASSGTEVASLDAYADDDGLSAATSKGWPTAYDNNRYMEVRFPNSLPNGFPIENARLEMSFSATASNDEFCTYLDFFKVSTGADDGRSGPVCAFGGFTFTLGLGGNDATTGWFNDAGIRLVGKTRTAGNTATFEQITLRGDLVVNGTRTPIVQHVAHRDERQDGVPTNVSYHVAKEDDRMYTSASGWPTTATTTRYLSATVPWVGHARLPTNATVTNVRLLHTWRPSGPSSACYYVRIRTSAGAGLAQSDAANPRCLAAGSALTQDVLDLGPSVAAAANSTALRVEFIYRSGDGATRTVHDHIALQMTYGVS